MPDDLPPTGSFPGYKLGKNLFLAWGNALEQHATIWNTAWGQFLSGKYELKDWYKAMADSLQVSISTIEQACSAAGSSAAAPPWVHLKYPSAEGDQEVKLRQPIDPSHMITPSKFTELGGGSAPAFTVTARMGSGPLSLLVGLNRSERPPDSGEYLGFIMSNHYTAPLAIVTVTV